MHKMTHTSTSEHDKFAKDKPRNAQTDKPNNSTVSTLHRTDETDREDDPKPQMGMPNEEGNDDVKGVDEVTTGRLFRKCNAQTR